MIQIFHMVMVFTAPVIFLAATVLYPMLFHWRRSFQGRALLRMLLALDLILGTNAVIALLVIFEAPIHEWWIYVATLEFLILNVAGIDFARAIIHARERNLSKGTK